MEENQMPKKRNYERYLEAQDRASQQDTPYSAPAGGGDVWTQDPFASYEVPIAESAYSAPTYAEPVTPQNYAGLEEPVTKGEWALCYFLMMIPCVGLIMMFVWAFSKTEKKSKSNFFKVQLIFMGVIFVLYFLIFLFAMGMGLMFA